MAACIGGEVELKMELCSRTGVVDLPYLEHLLGVKSCRMKSSGWPHSDLNMFNRAYHRTSAVQVLWSSA